MIVGGEFMKQKPGISLVVIALLIVTIFCPAAYADQNEALISAIRKSDLRQVQELLKKGADAKAKDGHGTPALVLAAESDYRGRMELVKLLMEKGADVNAKTKGGWTALMEAALRGHVELVKLLLVKGADVNATDRDGATALITATGRGHLDIVRLLVDKGADVNARTRSGHTALPLAQASDRADVVKFLKDSGASVHEAASDAAASRSAKTRDLLGATQKGDVKEVARLLDSGADINVKTKSGRTTLMEAVDRGNLDLVKLCLDRGADVNVKDESGETALKRAYRNAAIAELLLNKGADVNSADKRGVTALMTAAESGYLKTAQLLLARGAQLDVRDEKGRTALEHAGNHRPVVELLSGAKRGNLAVAAMMGDTAEVQRFLKKGADVNAKDRHGQTALISAVELSRLEVVKLLLDEGADVNLGKPLMYAADRGDVGIARLLLDRGADVNPKSPFGTALTKACEKDHLATASLLLDRGAEANAKDQNGETPLMKACARGYMETAGLLLDRGAEVNAKDRFGHTPLIKAAKAGHLHVVRFLLEKGADINVKNESGETPLMAAAGLGEFDIVELLLNKGAQLSAKDGESRTALEHAAGGNHRRVVDFLVSRGAKTNLAVASMLGDTVEVQRLLKEGADVNTKDDKGKTALILAVERNHPEVVKLLIKNHADVNVKASGETALRIARRQGSDEIYTVLRSNGAKTREGLRIMKYEDQVLRRGDELFFRLSDGRIISRKDTPDQYSDSRVHREFSDFIEPWYVIDEYYYECSGGQLLHRGSGQSTTVAGSLDFSPDKARFLALGCPDEGGGDEIWKMTDSGPVKEYVLRPSVGNSFRWADPSTVEVLSSHGASDYTMVGRFTLNAATGKWSCSEKDSKKSEQDSEESGQDLEEMVTEKMCGDATDNLEYALQNAVDDGDLEAVKTLLEKGANVNAKGQFERVLVDAAWKGHLEIVKLLLAKGAGTSESEKAQALARAAWWGHKEVVALLISHGAKLTLPVAAATGDLKAIKRLIKGGADVNARDKDHASAFSNAVQRNQWDAAILLLKSGVLISTLC
jgi:ankyrin repeat protein